MLVVSIAGFMRGRPLNRACYALEHATIYHLLRGRVDLYLRNVCDLSDQFEINARYCVGQEKSLIYLGNMSKPETYAGPIGWPMSKSVRAERITACPYSWRGMDRPPTGRGG